MFDTNVTNSITKYLIGQRYQMTLKSGVEMIIKKHVPEIEKVISVEV